MDQLSAARCMCGRRCRFCKSRKSLYYCLQTAILPGTFFGADQGRYGYLCALSFQDRRHLLIDADWDYSGFRNAHLASYLKVRSQVFKL